MPHDLYCVFLNSILIRLMDKILHYPFSGIYQNSHSLGSLGSCRILSISRKTLNTPKVTYNPEPQALDPINPYTETPKPKPL